MRTRGWFVVVGAFAASLIVVAAGPKVAVGTARSQSLAVLHDSDSCWTVGEFPFLQARAVGAAGIARAQLYFKQHADRDWYYVDMTVDADGMHGAHLPRPEASVGQVDYYALFVGENLDTAQTTEVTVDVRESCTDRRALVAAPTSLVVTGTVAGQAAVPPGFSANGITTFVTAAGESVSGAAISGAAAGAATGGISAATLGIIGGAGAAAAVGVAAAGGNDDGMSVGPTQSPVVAAMPQGPCIARLDQLELRLPQTAWTGTINCTSRNQQQLYQLTNRSACTVELRGLVRTVMFQCTRGELREFEAPLQLALSSVPPNSTTIVRMGPPAGTKRPGFCCVGDGCLGACDVDDIYVLDTNAGLVTVPNSHRVDGSPSPEACPVCPAPDSDWP